MAGYTHTALPPRRMGFLHELFFFVNHIATGLRTVIQAARQMKSNIFASATSIQ